MFQARFQVLHVLCRQSFLIQFLHRGSEIAYQSTALLCEIVDTGLTRSINVRIWRQVRFRLSRRRRNDNKSIAQQPGASNREFGVLWNLDVIINFQRHSHAIAFANQPRTTRNLSNSRAGEQDIGAFQKSARIGEANCQGVIGLETLP